MSEPIRIKELPPYARTACILFIIGIIVAGMYLGSPFLIPFAIAGLLAALLLPVALRLEKWGLRKILSILLCILLLILIMAALVFFFSYQISMFAQDLPQLREQVNSKLDDALSRVEHITNIPVSEQIQYLKSSMNSAFNNSGPVLKRTLTITTSALTMLALIPIYIFFMLLYRNRFRVFMLKIMPDAQNGDTDTLITDVLDVTQNYLSGVLTVIFILACMNSIGLLILGIKYAVFLGVLAAILNIIPYIGVLIGSTLPILVAILTKDSLLAPVGVFALFAFNQFVENNVLTPRITGSKVSINPLATIIALIIGGLIWGVAGMILFIPFLGVLKVIFDKSDSLRPYGYLIGNNDESSDIQKEKWKRRFSRVFGEEERKE